MIIYIVIIYYVRMHFVKFRSRSGEAQERVRRVRYKSGQLKGFIFKLKIWT